MDRIMSRLEATILSDEMIELRYRNISGTPGLLYWRIPVQEAEDLVSWWRKEAALFRNDGQPILNRKAGSVVVSMFTPSLVHVRCRNSFGKLKNIGYTFPGDLLESLSEWMARRNSDIQPPAASSS